MSGSGQAAAPGANPQDVSMTGTAATPGGDNNSDDSSSTGSVELPWSWLVKEAEIADLDDPEPLQAAHDKRIRNVRKVLKGNAGDWEYIEYLPEWTDPDWDPEYEVYPGTQTQKKRRKRDVTQVVRPALLVQDQIKNPTLHALRWGIHPDGAGGRSFTTPTVHMGTTVEVAGEGLKTAKDFLNATINTVAHPQGMSLRDYLDSHAGARDTLDPNNETTQAWLKLYDTITDNQDYQRFLFSGFTTDDFVEAKAYDPVNLTVPGVDLEGPLHPLVERGQWLTTAHLGGEVNKPRQLYNIYGCRGEYSAWDDLVWTALQPALQMASRILSSNHPYWLALLDIYCRFPIAQSRDPRLPLQKDRVPIRNGLRLNNDPADMWGEAQILKHLNYPSVDVTTKVLTRRITWELNSAFRPSYEPKQEIGTYGVTRYDSNIVDSPNIQIQLATELVFPLLVQDYSMGEKAVCSFLIAAVMLHELAHAANYAHATITGPNLSWLNIDPTFANFDRMVLDHLLALGDRLNDPTGRGLEEVFFDYEPRAEAGWAFEDKLFGGYMETVASSDFSELRWQTILGVKERWPSAAPFPSAAALEGTVTWLYDPPSHILDSDEIIPLSLCSRYFSQDFYNSQMQKFGWQALKLTPEGPTKVRTTSSMPWWQSMDPLYGSQDIREWIETANINLRRAGHSVIAEYLWRLSWESLHGENTKLVWNYEHETWPETDRQFNEMTGAIQEKNTMLWNYLRFIFGPRDQIELRYAQHAQRWQAEVAVGLHVGESQPTLQDFMRRHVIDTFRSFWRLFRIVDECHRLLSIELSYLQTLVADYLLCDAADRRYILLLWGNELDNRILNVHASLTTLCTKILMDLAQPATMLHRYNSPWAAQVDEQLKRYTGLHNVNFNHFVHTRSFLDQQHADIADASGNIASLQTIASGRRRKGAVSMRNMAIREISLLTEPVLREVVEKWYKLIQKRDELKSDNASADALSLKQSITDSVAIIRRKLESSNTSLEKFIEKGKGEKRPNRMGTSIFHVPERQPPGTQPAVPNVLAPQQAPGAPTIIKLSDFQPTPPPAEWNRMGNVTVNPNQQGGFAQFSNQPGFPVGDPRQPLFSQGEPGWQAETFGGSSATAMQPFPHPFATRDTIKEDVEWEKEVDSLTTGVFGGEVLQTQAQHGDPSAFQTYREERHSP